MLKVDSKVVSYHDKSVVRKRDPFSMDASERRMKRWNTKQFQKRKNTQQSRLMQKRGSMTILMHLTLLIAKKKLSLKQQESQLSKYRIGLLMRAFGMYQNN